MTRDLRGANGSEALRALEAVLGELTLSGKPVSAKDLAAELRSRGQAQLLGRAMSRPGRVVGRLLAEGQSLGRIVLVSHAENGPLYGPAAKFPADKDAGEMVLPRITEVHS